MIGRLAVRVVLAFVGLWLALWILVHLGLLITGALGFAAWSWWRDRHRA